MSEASQAVIRSIALAALSVLFAGVWGNDRPANPTLAFLPADQRTFVIAAPQPSLDAAVSRVASLAAVREVRRETGTKAIPTRPRHSSRKTRSTSSRPTGSGMPVEARSATSSPRPPEAARCR